MSKADDYRKRAKGLAGAIKNRNRRDRPGLQKKQDALFDLADNEDWLDGKPPKRLTADACRQQAVNCRVVARDTMTASHRIMLEHIADTWERIAVDIDNRSGRVSSQKRSATIK